MRVHHGSFKQAAHLKLCDVQKNVRGACGGAPLTSAHRLEYITHLQRFDSSSRDSVLTLGELTCLLLVVSW